MSSKNKLTPTEAGKKIIMMYLFCQGMKFIDYGKDYDLKMFSEKNNEEVLFGLEIDLRSKDVEDLKIKSSLLNKKSDWIIYWFKNISYNNLWMIKTNDLKKLIKSKKEIVYIPKYKSEYKKKFRIDTIKVRNHERKL
tara:strand:- start:575 stop:985 length:411 start_codon:yes stop_codon:yes gene_type:complete